MHRPDDSAISPYVSLRLAQGLPAGGLCAFPSNPTPHPDAGGEPRLLDRRPRPDRVYTFGSAPYFGGLNRPAGHDTGRRPRPDGRTATGYWLVDAAGDVAPFGAAPDFGSMAGTQLVAPMIGIDADRYRQRLLAARARRRHLQLRRRALLRIDGRRAAQRADHRDGVDADRPAATGSSAPTAASSASATRCSRARRVASASPRPSSAWRTTASGTGYWLLGGDGGVFAFGDAPYTGSIPGTGLCTRPGAVSLTGTNSGHGYWVLHERRSSSCRSGTRCTTATRRPTASSRSPSLPSADATTPAGDRQYGPAP